jgi:hypothetical protein
MNLDEIHELLTKDIGLLVDSRERGNGRTYFFKKVSWMPSDSTRVCRVLWDGSSTPTSIQLCISSDNNNSVFLRTPLLYDRVLAAVLAEIANLKAIRRRSKDTLDA